jgi:hypothetical protein
MSASDRFCCRSQLRLAANRDSVVLTRISARSIHDGPSEETKINCSTSFVLAMWSLEITSCGRSMLLSIFPGFAVN